MRRVADEQFQITYDGPALETNRMDVRLLAPALLALADLLQASNRVANPQGPPPALHIDATRPGSFAVELLLVDPASLIDRAVGLFSSKEAGATADAIGILTPVFGGLALLARIAYRRIRRRDDVRPGWVRITFDDDSTLDLPSSSVQLAEDLDFRRAANQMVEPLRMDGIETVSLSHDNAEAVRVGRNDLPGFDVPEAGEVLLSDQTRQVALRLRNVAFVPGNKWRVSDGENDLFVIMDDSAFVERVYSNEESFAAGDILRCELRTQQWQTQSGAIRNDHTVTRVIEHRRGPRTVPLPFEEADHLADDYAGD
jgi:hypothetical protein